MAEELRQQVPVIKDVLRAMDIEIIEKEGLEADDLLGTIAHLCEEKGMDVSIISGDRDTLQLATEHVKIRIPKTKQGRTEVEDYNAAEVKERYGVTPKEFIDVKALMGDASDNIPACRGWARRRPRRSSRITAVLKMHTSMRPRSGRPAPAKICRSTGSRRS